MKTPHMRQLFEAFFNTTLPYEQRMVDTNNDAAQSLAMQSFPFEKITTPSLIVHGTLDGDVPFANGVYAASHVSGAQHYWMVNKDHLDFWLRPDAAQAQQIVITFFQQHASQE